MRKLLLCVALLCLGCGADSSNFKPRDLTGGPGGGGDSGNDPLPTDDLEVTGGEDLSPAGVEDGSGAYDDIGTAGGDGGNGCVPPNMAASCATPLPSNAGCLFGAADDCGPNGLGNGLDDNCNGTIDENCQCVAGSVMPCFLGPPGLRGVGACRDGTQTCRQISEVETGWGACQGGIGRGAEVCDKLDNDCNGCADDGLCCDATLLCPSTVPDAAPFSTISYDGTHYFKGTAATWSWSVDGGPCDQLFKTTTGNPPKQSFTLSGSTSSMASLLPTLSGDYTVTMSVTDSNGKSYQCKWIQHVIGPGVRVELCWDKQGSAPVGADLDLHLHRSGTTTPWFQSASGARTPAKVTGDDCNYLTCTASNYSSSTWPAANWSYPMSPLAECINAPGGSAWSATPQMMCANPRLDVDNISSVGVPENINVSKPANNDSFRVMVHYYGQGGGASVAPLAEHPIVNIYCGGSLKATYGQAPNTLAGFTTGKAWTTTPAVGQMWRVADVRAAVDATGTTTGCTINAIHPPGMATGYYLTTDNVGY
jgi:hypothetical protein